MRPILFILCVFAALAIEACATSVPAPPKEASPERLDHCRDLMYIARLPRGPPNWNLYERCLRGMPGT